VVLKMAKVFESRPRHFSNTSFRLGKISAK